MRAKLAPIIYGRVTSAPPGKGSAIVLTGAQHWNARLSKKFTHPKKIHISDPSHAVRRGDTVAIAPWPSLSKSKRITHTVTQIVSPWGGDGAAPLSERPAVWTEEQRVAWRREKLLQKGTFNTIKGLRDGSIYIGEEGKIMQRTPDDLEMLGKTQRRAEARYGSEAVGAPETSGRMARSMDEMRDSGTG